MSGTKLSTSWSWVQRFRSSRRRLVMPAASRKAALNIESLEDRNLMAVALSGGFSGLAFDLNQGATPPDTIAAVGPTAVGEAVNTNLEFFSKSGGTLFQGSFETMTSGCLLTDASRAMCWCESSTCRGRSAPLHVPWPERRCSP